MKIEITSDNIGINKDGTISKVELEADSVNLESGTITRAIREVDNEKNEYTTKFCTRVENSQHTLEDLKQKLINDMYDRKSYFKEDIEILKLLFETKKD